MRKTLILGCLALFVAAFALSAWRVEAGDGKPTIDDRIAALEAKVAALEARLAALALPLAPPAAPAAAEPAIVSDPKGLATLRAIKVNLDIKDQPIQEAIRILADVCKLNILVSPLVPKTPVTLKIEDLDMPTVLDMLAGAGGFKWNVVPYGIVRITER